MTREDLFRAVGYVEERQILEAARRPLRPRARWLAAACLALLLSGLVLSNSVLPEESRGPDPGVDQGSGAALGGQTRYSYGVEIGYLDGNGGETQRGTAEDRVSSSFCLASLTPEELLNRDTLIFRGTVESLTCCTAEGVSLDGFTLAEVRVSDVLRGELTEGELCRVFLPLVSGVFSNSLAGDLENLTVGSEAVFMPSPAGPDTGLREAGAYLCYADVADAYFSEGIRFLFLQTEEGVSFQESAYPDLAGAQTLEEVTDYLREFLEQSAS